MKRFQNLLSWVGGHIPLVCITGAVALLLVEGTIRFAYAAWTGEHLPQLLAPRGMR